MAPFLVNRWDQQVCEKMQLSGHWLCLAGMSFNGSCSFDVDAERVYECEFYTNNFQYGDANTIIHLIFFPV